MEQNKVQYTKKHWETLAQKRNRVIKLINIFQNTGFKPLVFGSIARGDIHAHSDIDIVFPQTIPTFRIELLLEENGENIVGKEIIQATPGGSIKAYIFLSELESLTIPLTKFRGNSFQFYKFGGSVNLNQLQNNERVPGINKGLIIIIPDEDGHNEMELLNNEVYASKLLKIDLVIIKQRMRVLTKREKIGRTGVFLHEKLTVEENFESVLKKIGDRNSIVRKILKDN